MRAVLANWLGATVPYITFFPAVMFAAWFGGVGPGILATVLSLVAAFSLAIPAPATPVDVVGALVFVGVSILTSVLNEALRRSHARSEERYQALVRETSRRSLVEEELAKSRRDAETARDLFHTTLSSIGDAVIATDAQGKVTFLNTVAQELTGWSVEEAQGKAIAEVFPIRNERTGMPAGNLVDQVIREGAVVILANHTVLVTKSGREIPIEDSAAPIRDGKQQILGVVLVFRDATYRRQAEEAHQRNEERLKLALNAGSIGVWDWDIVHNRIDWSDRVYEIHGIESGTLSGGLENYEQLIHPQDRKRIREAIGAALRSGAPYEVEFRVVRPDSTVVWVATTARVFRDHQGEPVRMLGSATDVTARKQAEENLQQQWRTFDIALSNTPDFTYIFDLDGRFTYVNRALLSLWQKPLDQTVGKNFFDLDYPLDLAGRLQRQIQQVIDTRGPIRDRTPFTGPTGETRTYEYIFVPVLAADGGVEAVAGSTRDITESSRSEEALRASEERLTFALEAGGGVGVWDWDIPSDRVYCTPPFAALFSVDPARAAEGVPLSQFLDRMHPEDRGPVKESIQRAAESGSDFSGEYRVVQGDSSIRWIYARGRCHLDKDGKPARFPGVAIDITERKRAEEELRRSNEELKRVNRDLEEFAYVTSHDLQEPLRMVSVYTQILLNELGLEDTSSGLPASFIRQGVNRMQTLIRDLLTFSSAVHTDEPAIGSADLNTALNEAISVVKGRIEECSAVVIAEPLPRVRGDVVQLAHVFQNLISNAVKYRKDGVAPRIQVTVEKTGEDWVVSVRDNGIGFDPQYSERIFGLFKRLHKDEYPGTGLGLAICKRIVERYGGRIWAEGTPGQGATFRFALPPAKELERAADSIG